MEEYFAQIESGVALAYEVAKKAREKGLDPEEEVSIPLAKNMAERVEGLISVVAPQIRNCGIIERIIELEKEFGQLDWRVGFKIAEEVAKQKFCSFSEKIEAIEMGIRTGFAYLTLGIVSAPLEGFIGLTVKKRKDGKEYLALRYAGPIRGAGGTAASVSVILSDYVRVKMGYATWDAQEKEISRYCTEVHDYHDRVTNLQYHPSDDELSFMLSHLPIEVDGDPTERFEVSNYKDLERIPTNLIRGGMCLVLAEGLCQKAPKLWKRLSKWGKSFDLDWEFMGDFLKLKEKIHAKHSSGNKKEKKDGNKVQPNNTYIMDLVAGRPILGHPMAKGSFRLRYGRNRTSGFSACAAHPATLVVLDKYIAIGTQLKVERPGKATTITICDTLDGPIVRLEEGDVVKLHTAEDARAVHKKIESVLFLGDILFNYGDFSENGHVLVPVGYCEEWWALEVEKEMNGLRAEKPGAEIEDIDAERLKKLIDSPLLEKITLDEAITISRFYGVALHPSFTFYFSLMDKENIILLLSWLSEGKIKKDNGKVHKIILPHYSDKEKHSNAKKVLEKIGLPHKVINKESVVIEGVTARSISICFGLEKHPPLDGTVLTENIQTGLDFVNSVCEFTVKNKAGTFIGSRMGRPEKAKMRSMQGSPQVMFPVGEEGGRMRSFQEAMKQGKIRSSFPNYFCEACSTSTIYLRCERCNEKTSIKYHCRFCGDLEGKECRHGEGATYKTQDLDIKHFFADARKKSKERITPELIKGVRGTSNKNHVTEHLAKGILRAKHALCVNKDGSIRYDCTQLPLTHFRPKEISASVEKLRELGYDVDYLGNELVSSDQLCEIKPQDIVIPGFDSIVDSAPKVLSRVAKFVDDELVQFYGLDPFYNIEKQEDLIGHLVIALAPHISAGLVGRIIGYSETQGLLTNPMFHAGLRRDCDGDEAAVMLLMDSLLNFSRQFLPSSRGGTMDSPLVLTSILDPAEVDDQVHGIDVVWKYPLALYEAAQQIKKPWEVVDDKGNKIEQMGDRLGKASQYEDFGFTHHVSNFNNGVQCSAYKTLPSMKEKLFGQMEIARKIKAVDMDDVARLVIQKHFLKDIKGNLRKFSMQQFRCVACNTKYRRPPLIAKCTECGGKLIFTISHGSVIKYLGPSMELADKFDFSPYLKQTLDIIQSDVDHIFGKEKDKQVGLGSFIG